MLAYCFIPSTSRDAGLTRRIVLYGLPLQLQALVVALVCMYSLTTMSLLDVY